MIKRGWYEEYFLPTLVGVRLVLDTEYQIKQCQSDLISPGLPGIIDEPQYIETLPTIDDLLSMSEAAVKKILASLTISDLKALRKELEDNYLTE